MHKKKLAFPFLSLLVFLITSKQLYAQTDSVIAVVKALRSIRERKNFDTALFINRSDAISSFDLKEPDIAALNTVAQGFDKGADLDFDVYIRYRILQSLSKFNVYRAIDYGRQQMATVEKNTGSNHRLLNLHFLGQLRVPYRNSDRIGEGFLFFNGLLAKSKAAGDSTGAMWCYFILSGFYRTIGLYDVAIYHLKKARTLTDSSYHQVTYFLSLQPITKGTGAWLNYTGILGDYCLLKGDFEASLLYSRQAYAVDTGYSFQFTAAYHLKNLAGALQQLNKLDSADFYLEEALKYTGNEEFVTIAAIMQVRSLSYMKRNQFENADRILTECWKIIRENRLIVFSPPGVLAPDYYLALVKLAQQKLPEAVSLLNSDLDRIKGIRVDELRDYKLLGDTYSAMGDQQKSKESYAQYIKLQDALQADQTKFRMLSFETEEQIAAKEKSILQLKTDNRISRILWIFSLGIVLLLIVVALLIHQRYRAKKKDNFALEKTLTELKNTQSQLIQSEKMASLGELTAGIAHEIQNPLNFVNNFSEINTELIVELAEEADKGNIEEVKIIANDIKDNSLKINHHGKRADAIVKGMLQHSRQSSGTKEPTDINALADEYLRLSYHGLRAKDKAFNATLNTNYDASIGNINIIPQDIGRVLLNLFNNAFYAVTEKQKTAGEDYQPTVSISTKKSGNNIELTVSDNGNGIPSAFKEKIFQPFFTTKPTGQGTGLGLSLSYDIVKAHGGELKAETKQGEGSTFIIKLPII